MSKPFANLIFIGRFQPLHNGHIHVIAEAAKLADKVIILVGSSNLARSPKNPFTFEERSNLIWKTCSRIVDKLCPGVGMPLEVHPLNDYPYNDERWLTNANRIIAATKAKGRTGIVGFTKDHSSYYLKMFPELETVEIQPESGLIDSTGIRKNFFTKGAPIFPSEAIAPQATIQFLIDFFKTSEYRWLRDEHFFYDTYRAEVYPITICCADAVVIQSGHILLVQRKRIPGRGLLALPGGHKNQDETFRAAALRELREETHIADDKGELPPAMLSSFIIKERMFDDPSRSQRGTVVTLACLFNLPKRNDLFKVLGDDDAEKAQWHDLSSLNPTDFFEDHFHIIQEMVGI